MYRKVTILLAVLTLGLAICTPATSLAGANVPVTPIDKILAHKSGLALDEAQIKKLDLINRSIVDKMIQTKAQADIRKTEIDSYTSNWQMMHGTAVEQNIKEYYQFLAALKTLEVEAIMKARAILTREQLKKFGELVSIEVMMLKLEQELADAY